MNMVPQKMSSITPSLKTPWLHTEPNADPIEGFLLCASSGIAVKLYYLISR